MKKIILALLLIFLLVISGCKVLELKPKLPGKLPGSTVSGQGDFIGGRLGLTATIATPVEKGKAYSGETFNAVVSLKNEGEATAEGATCVFGSFSGCECQDFVLEGRRMVEGEKLEGEETTLTFTGNTVEKDSESSNYVTAKTRYDYKTYGIIQACIKKEPYSKSKEECNIVDENVVKSASSAPLNILEIKEELVPETDRIARLIFDVKLKHVGEGKLYSLDEGKDQCETSPEMKPRIDARLINAPGNSNCNSVELKEDEAELHCTVKDVELLDEGYEVPITLELSYAYETIDSNQFEVV